MVWNPIEQPTDVATLAGRQTPGVIEVVGLNTPRRWDEREAVAFSGAIVVYYGQKLAHFTLRIKLYTVADWNAWHAFAPLVQRVPVGKRQGALDLDHPVTKLANIRSVVIDDVLGPEQTDNGEWTFEIKVIEFRAPKLALAKPEGAESTPVDPEVARIASLQTSIDLAEAEYQALASERP
jgi:hypothetical protein